ncbi:hypothetical protein HCA63_04710 [Listeria booriae]|uniref:hypothetical protein n=1 Tax=Listeria booriae TaxID=1552123 RepID=UPI001624ED49|nr:hypothetical protein [Listeria booriae]MBC1887652.1 hypothetical protein [Listeria booriae]
MRMENLMSTLVLLIVLSLVFVSSSNVSAADNVSASTQEFLKVASVAPVSENAGLPLLRAASTTKYYKYQWTRGANPLMYVKDVIYTKETSSSIQETSKYQQSGYILPYYASHKGLSRSSSGAKWIKYQSKKVMSIKYPTPWGQTTLIKNNLVDYRTVQ